MFNFAHKILFITYSDLQPSPVPQNIVQKVSVDNEIMSAGYQDTQIKQVSTHTLY